MSTMREAVISRDLQISYRDVPVPKPLAGQVLIEVKVCGSNPKDWKTELVADDSKFPLNMGDDLAGIIVEVGEGVTKFRPGDRVFAFHEIQAPHGGWARYAIAHEYMTAHLPASVSFEAASTVPLAAITAILALQRDLKLPTPFNPLNPNDPPTPLLIYGASGAVGAYAVQIASLAGIHPIIGVAGAGCDHVRSLLDESKGDRVIDYRNKSPVAVDGEIRTALGGLPLYHALEATGLPGPSLVCAGVLEKNGAQQSRLSLALPPADPSSIPQTIAWGIPVSVLVFYGLPDYGIPEDPSAKDLGHVYMQVFARWLDNGRFKPQPHELVPGGLEAVETVIDNLKSGKASGKKFVFSP